MTTGPGGIKHLILGLLLLLAGALFVFNGIYIKNTEHGFSREVILIPNQGGEMEGHTSMGFSGSGEGLFVGDNINENFPEGDGVQIFLTFDIENLLGEKIKSAKLISENVHTKGSPLGSLGELGVYGTKYEKFSSKVWNNEVGDLECNALFLEDGSFSCDITKYIERILREGDRYAQFVLRFEKVTDNDRSPDLVLFYKENSNTNEEGIFHIRVNDDGDRDSAISSDEEIVMPIVLHRVIDSEGFNTSRTKEEIENIFEEVSDIWKQANIKFEGTVVDTKIEDEVYEKISNGLLQEIYAVTADDDLSLHAYFMKDIEKGGSISFPPLISIVFDSSDKSPHKLFSYEIGRLFELEEEGNNKELLMNKSREGEALTEREIKYAREYAEDFKKEIERREGS